MLHGTISYPFVETKPLGINGKPNKFIIRTIKGNTEYVVEIPEGGESYDIEIPMASLGGDSLVTGNPKLPSEVSTDRELTQAMPDISDQNPGKSALLDKAFGTAEQEMPEQAPSYSLGLAKVTRFFKKRQYEYALIECNNLLNFYPTSTKLLKMKGTIYIKLNQLKLAEAAWAKALDVEPQDKILDQSLKRLQKKIQENTISRGYDKGSAFKN